MQACPLPEPVPVTQEGTSLRELYLQMLRDLTPWGECARNHSQLIAVVKYRDSVCEKIKADNAKPKPWWQIF